MTANLTTGPEEPGVGARLRTVFEESWKYFLVSVASLALDVAVYWTQIHFLGLHYLIANVASVASGLILNYLLSIAFVFKQRRLSNRRAEFVGFVLIGLAGLAVNEWLIAIFVGTLGFGTLFGKVAAAGGSFVFNFGARKLLLFSARGRAREDAHAAPTIDPDRA